MLQVLVEEYHYTAFSTLVYVRPGRNASAVEAGARRVPVVFPKAMESSFEATAETTQTQKATTCAHHRHAKEKKTKTKRAKTDMAASSDVIAIDDSNDEDEPLRTSSFSTSMPNNASENSDSDFE